MTFWFNEIFPVGRYGSFRPSGTQPRRHVGTINLRRSCWNGCFFRPLHAPLVSASQSKKWSRDDKHLLRDYILQYSCCKLLRSCTFEAKPILAIDFASVELFSVTHFELYLSKKDSAKLNKLADKLEATFLTVGKIRWFYSWEKSVHHYFFFFWIREAKPRVRANGLKNRRFNKHLGSIVSGQAGRQAAIGQQISQFVCSTCIESWQFLLFPGSPSYVHWGLSGEKSNL